jgi:DNA replication protein DnaC
METKEATKKALSQITQAVSESEDILCCICGTELILTPEARLRLGNFGNAKCLKCQREVLDKFNEEQALREAKIKRRSLDMVPQLFRTTEREKLPKPEKLDAALNWKYGPKGLLLHGPTDCGKSRILWEVAKREIQLGRSVRGVSPYELTKYPAMIAAGDGSAIEFSDDLVQVGLLILDDVFKAKPTERIEELLFAVIDERGAWERPCLVSLNDTGETLKERLSTDRGPALIRRLRDYCIPIQF